ncbi:MAG TPA: hypothetical protein GXX35_04380 [Thermoanaerobacterales bacterium]|nr:hypothetical protein [Thermoanaerobacterales bacterium]
MILPKETIYRYMRHIIMPEISGPGQKKLLESRVLILAESVRDAAPLMYYLVASGIGLIKYHFEVTEGFEDLKESLQDLNPEILVEKADFSPVDNEELKSCLSCQIVFGNNFESKSIELLKAEFDTVPTILALPSDWCGIIQSVRNIKDSDLLSDFLNKLPYISDSSSKVSSSPGIIFSRCFLGALVAIETIKICLNLKGVSENPLYFNLLNMDFKKLKNESVKTFLYDIQPSSTEFLHDLKSKLALSKVLIVGTGGLGSPAAYALTLAGVGTLGLTDSDKVEISNLNRQILHSTSRIGMPKVDSAEMFLKRLNPDINIVKYETLFAKNNAFEIIKDFDVIIDGVDNLPTRYLLNDACFFAEKPLAEAGVLRFDGLGMTIFPKRGHCYRCIFPEMPPAGSIPSCSESGILGPVPGVMGFIEAAETVKILTGTGKTLIDRLIIFDALELDFRVTDVKRDDRCPLCGQNPYIKNLIEYEIKCEGDAL